MDRTFFVGKYCKLVTDNGFVIHGTVTDADDIGFYFKTPTTTSYFTWKGIRSLKEAEA